jgi:hypothetical protein
MVAMTPAPAPADHFTPRFGSLYRSLIINIALPLIVVQVLLRTGTPPVTALALAAIIPAGEAIIGLVRTRRFDPINVLSLVAIVVGIGTSGITGNAGFAVAKDSLFTIVFGILFLGSLATPRPMIFSLGKQFATGGDPAAAAAWDTRLAEPGFMRTVRLITAVWGCGLLLEAVLRIVAAFTLPPTSSTIVSPVLQVVTFGALILFTTRYVRVMRRRAAAAGRPV